MVTTTTAIQVDVTPQLLKKSLGSLIGLHASGKLIFLPITEEDVVTESWSSEKGVPAEEVLSYLKSIDG